MAFEGSLEDLSVVDVLQLLHVSKKTGVLLVRGASGEARIAIKDGAIVGCQHPTPGVNVGNMLLELGALTQDAIDAAVAQQRAAGDAKRPLVQTLIELGRVDEKAGWQALERLVERTVVEVVSWSRGSFSFDMGDVVSNDGFRHLPDGVASAVSIDVQGALLDAMRILDERNRAAPDPDPPVPAGAWGAEPEPPEDGAGRSPVAVTEEEADAGNAAAGTEPASATPPDARAVEADGTAARPVLGIEPPDEEGLLNLIGDRLSASVGSAPRHRAVMFCGDGFLKLSARAACAQHQIELFVTDVEQDVMHRLSAWRSQDLLPALIVDLAVGMADERWARRSVGLVKRVKVAFAEVPITVLNRGDLAGCTQAFGLGATSVIPRPVDAGKRDVYVGEMKQLFGAVAACLRATFARRSALEARVMEHQRGMAVLRERMHEIRDPQGPSDISLVVMRYVADFVDRCVLFLVRNRDLLGLGAFGIKGTDETLSRAITKLKIPFSDDSILTKTARDGHFFHGRIDDRLLHETLYRGIGAPVSPEIILLPLRTRERTAALIYGDFGTRESEAVQTDALEILADHAGMAFELALWQRRVN